MKCCPKGQIISEVVFAAEPLWARSLADEARAGSARLHTLERYVAEAERRLMSVRRPAALSRIVALGLSSWGLWAGDVARRTGVAPSSAWRALEHAAALGLVEPVPGAAGSRGGGKLYAIPPWLKLAGLVAMPRGRPPRAEAGTGRAGGLAAALAEVAAAMAATGPVDGEVADDPLSTSAMRGAFGENLSRSPAGGR